MQNKHYFFFFLFGNPNVRGGGGRSSRLGQNPNFYQKFVLEASLNMFRKDFSYLSPGEKSSEGKHAGWHSSSSRQVKHQDLHSLAAPAGPWPQDTADFCLDSLSLPPENQ